MSRSYDIFLSHSGAQKGFVEHLNTELARVCGQYSVFFDRDAIEHGDQISSSILEYAGTCKLAVAVVSEEYFTRSRPPMLELAASYTAAKAGNGFPSLPCLFPVFFALHPEDAKDSSTQSEWRKVWDQWEVNERMSERRKSRPRRVQPTVWKEAVDRLLDTRGPVYIPQEYGYDPKVFLKSVAEIIGRKLDVLNGGIGPSKVGDEVMPPSKEVDSCEDASGEVDSTENSAMGFGVVFNRLLGSGNSRDAGMVIDEKDALPEPYSVVACLDFGSTSSSFAFSHSKDPEDIYICNNYPGSRKGIPSCRTVTGIYYSSNDGGQSYQVESWGNLARSSYERDQRRAGRSMERFFGFYATRFNPHLKIGDTQMLSGIMEKLPYSLPVDRLVTDFLHKFGAYILHKLQESYELDDMTMKKIQWCVPVPSSWDNYAAQEKMKICMKSAGLINGTDGSPFPIKMVGKLEAASLWGLKSNELQPRVGDKLLVVDIGESFFHFVVQKVVSVCIHNIHRVKEVSSRLFTRHSFPHTEFMKLLHHKIGPCLQEFLTEYPNGCLILHRQWDLIKLGIGDATCSSEELYLPTGLVKILVGHEQKRVPGRGSEVREDIDSLKISYSEFESLLDPVVEELVWCISRTYTEVGGVKSLVLVGDCWLAGSPYVVDKIRRRFSRLVPQIITLPNFNSATCLGTVALAQDLCNTTCSTS